MMQEELLFLRFLWKVKLNIGYFVSTAENKCGYCYYTTVNRNQRFFFLSVNSIINNNRGECVLRVLNGLSHLILRKILLIKHVIPILQMSTRRLGEVGDEIGAPSQVFLPQKPDLSATALSSHLATVRMLMPLIQLHFPKQVISPRIIGLWEILPPKWRVPLPVFSFVITLARWDVGRTVPRYCPLSVVGRLFF